MLSYELQEGSSLELLRQLKSDPKINLPVILMAHDTSAEVREKAMRIGALDFVVKTPYSLSAMARIVVRNGTKFNLKQEITRLRSKLERREFLEQMMGKSDVVRVVQDAIERVAWTDFSVLICGETGVGKEIVAQAIHEYSLRRDGPFVTLDCGAIPETLMESVIAGYRKGAFTGADHTHDGHFQRANGGTLF